MWSDADSSVVKNILKLDEMCTVLFVQFVCFITNIFVCLFDNPNYYASTKVAISRSIALESTCFTWWLTHLFLTSSLTCLWVTISLSCKVLFPCLSSSLLRSCPYGTMHSTIVQCNAGTFYSLFIWQSVL